MTRNRKHLVFAGVALVYLAIACAVPDPSRTARYRWWSGLGPVLPHDTFDTDCKLCHVGEKWHTLVTDFSFDHEKETGVALEGAHAQAQCLRCHNDRGPIDVFASQGCAGCHEDVHRGALGQSCTNCHQQNNWLPVGQIEMHSRTRFPLVGAHAATACNRCHPGAFVGNFVPTDTECLTCHQDDLQVALNPPHLALGWVDNCDRCHMPTRWNQAQVR